MSRPRKTMNSYTSFRGGILSDSSFFRSSVPNDWTKKKDKNYSPYTVESQFKRIHDSFSLRQETGKQQCTTVCQSDCRLLGVNWEKDALISN